ncbi:MAG: outer membrane protein assembly factor BamD [Candidatus Sulfotelmatobacter sp.]
MSRRTLSIALLGLLLAFTAACTNKKSVNPLAGIGSKQPDKVLFDKAMDAMRHNRFDVARLTLQTLINTYPDSEYIARAKLAVGDSWYAEGGAAALAQAEQEYSDFEIFFPNMPEAAEAQLKIANIHYQQMEKADRDYTHAKRAEDEYRKVILQYPDSKVVPEAKRKLLEVQEVLADREFGIGRFYYLRESYPASIARLKSLLDKYPLYSRADEAAWLLGQDYEGQMARLRSTPTCDAKGLPRGCASEAAKAKYFEQFTRNAAEAYDKIVTRYPMMDRADDARRRLTALHQPVPRPTKAAVLQNKREIASRGETTMMGRVSGIIKKGPDVARATQVGEPNLVEPEPVAATTVVRQEALGAMGGGEKTVGVDVVKQPGANDLPPAADATANSQAPFGQPAAGTTPPVANDPNELKPTASADSNELTPTSGDQPLPPPAQVNEIQSGQSSSTPTAQTADSTPASDADLSSSKKRKRGLKKIIPF